MFIFLDTFFSNPTVKKVLLGLTLGCLAVAFYVFYEQKTNMYLENVKQIQQIHDEEIRKINTAYDEERRQHEINMSKLQLELDAAKTKYKEDTAALDKKKKSSEKSIATKYADDPSGMATRISKVTGFRIVLP